jgi:hypothetical protein
MAAEASLEQDRTLVALLSRTPLLPDPLLRKHWQRVIAWLPSAAKHELAEILLAAEEACRD